MLSSKGGGADQDSRPTVELRPGRPPIAQRQMEEMFLRVHRSLFGDFRQNTMAHYVVVRPIGQGAMGMVYEAIDPRLNREVALKLVLPDLLHSQRSKTRLLREARAMAQISHPNVAAVYDVGESGGAVFIAMELIRGTTMRQWLEAAPRALPDVLEMFIQAGSGLAAAHDAQIVHRDFKPDNVLIGTDGRARVVDFGLAFPRWNDRGMQHGGGDAPSMIGMDVTSSAGNTIAGTVAYMSPEQLQAGTLDGRSDQFSFCVTLYEALFGHRPFAGTTYSEVVEQVLRGEVAFVADPPRIPSWLEALLRRGLSIDADLRFGSMAEVVNLLSAGRMLASQRIAPELEDLRWPLAAALRCTVDEVIASSRFATTAHVRSVLDGTRSLVIVAHDPRATRARAAFSSYVRRAGAVGLPHRLRPASIVDGPCLALSFDDIPCVTLGALIHQPARRDVVAALEIAGSLARAVYELAQAGYALDPASLERIPVGIESYAIGPVDPSQLVDREGEEEPCYRAVGVALRALLTGESPELVGRATAPRDELPFAEPVRKVVARLLDVDRGYRSARGLLHDLARCAATYRRREPEQVFLLGTRDITADFEISEQVRGREIELERFEIMVDQIDAEGCGLALVTGPSGIGKTLLIAEMSSRVGRGHRIQGKFDQYANNEPYATLTQALRVLVREILDGDRTERDDWRDRIVSAVAPNAELLRSTIPELHALIGDQPAAMPPASAARFGETLRRMLIACAAKVELLVVVLDDMQWCDQASIGLICSLLRDGDVGNMLWICAYRDDALADEHPLHRLLALAARRERLTATLSLRPLSRDDLCWFLVDTLGCSADRAAPLATFFHDRTDGNPLFARTLVAALHEQGMFAFCPRRECWVWDDAAIRSAELPGGIQELIARKIESLSSPARAVLSIASCIGRDIDVSVLYEVMSSRGCAEPEFIAAVHECIMGRLLAATVRRVPGAADEQFISLLNFTHDRVQQTAYGFLPPIERAPILLDAGRAMLDRASPAELAQKLFRIVGYLNGGAVHADERLKVRIIDLDLNAAQRALVANAFGDSARLLEAAMRLLPADCWRTRYEQTVELYVKYMHAQALLGRRKQEDEMFELLRRNVRTSIDIARIYELKVMLESSRGEHRAAIDRGIEGLHALGEKLARAPGRFAAMVEFARTWRALRCVDPDEIHRRPLADTDHIATTRVLVALSAPAYLANSNLFAIVMMRIVRRSLQFGMSETASHGFAGYGLLVSGLLGHHERGRRYAMVAHRLDERFANGWLKPRVSFMSGIFVQPWTRSFEKCEEILGHGARVAVGNADFVYASYTLTSMACLRYYRGERLDAVAAFAAATIQHTQRAGDYDMETVAATVMRVGLCLRGETPGPDDFSMAEQSDRDFLASLDERTTPIGVFFCRAIRCGVLYLHGHADLACELGWRATEFEDKAFSNPSLAEFHFYFAMALMQRWPDLTGRERRRARRVVRRALANFERWARCCPENFASRHQLLRGEHARVVGQPGTLDHLNAAFELAVLHRRVQYEALAAELAARHCQSAEQTTIGEIYRVRAIAAYARWGAAVKVRQLHRPGDEVSPCETRPTRSSWGTHS